MNHTKKIIFFILIFISTNTFALWERLHSPTESPIPDIVKTCEEIEYEILYNQHRIYDLIPTRGKHDLRHMLLSSGTFWSIPWLFLHFNDGDRYAIQNLVIRNDWLRSVAKKDYCYPMPQRLGFPENFDTPDVYMVDKYGQRILD